MKGPIFWPNLPLLAMLGQESVCVPPGPNYWPSTHTTITNTPLYQTLLRKVFGNFYEEEWILVLISNTFLS